MTGAVLKDRESASNVRAAVAWDTNAASDAVISNFARRKRALAFFHRKESAVVLHRHGCVGGLSLQPTGLPTSAIFPCQLHVDVRPLTGAHAGIKQQRRSWGVASPPQAGKRPANLDVQHTNIDSSRIYVDVPESCS